MLQQVLIIGFVWPEPNSSAAGTRMLQLIALFQKQNWKITFASAAADSAFMFDVASLGIDRISIELNNASFDLFVSNLNPTLVLFDRFMVEEQFGWRIAKHCPKALRMLDTEDLHCLRRARQKAVVEQNDFDKVDLFSDTAKREIASILRCDLSLIISEFEMELLKNHFKIERSLLYYLPFLVDEITEETVKMWPKFEDRKDIIFIGNFLHEPNWDSVQYLKESIWPIIQKKLPGVCLHIYGAYPSQKVMQMNNPVDRFLVFGRAENAFTVIKNARLLLAPIRFGAGAKGKLIEAMQCGTPNVTTTIGAESMSGNLPWSGIIADDMEAIAHATSVLYQDESIWKNAQKNGKAIINERYASTLFIDSYIQHILAVQLKIEAHRKNNFIGSLLMHHSMASTKYMSKWIEEKNK